MLKLWLKNSLAVCTATACIALFSCNRSETEKVDTIVLATKIYISNDAFESAEAMAIKDGKVLAFGSKKEITAKYQANHVEEYNAYIYPGLIDAHSHFYGFGKNLNDVDLKGTSSMEQVVQKAVAYAQNTDAYWVLGRGWDQNDWTVQSFPNNLELSLRLPDRPVLLKRVDGHAALANRKALELAGITTSTQVEGGEIEIRNGQLTGVLIDNAVNLVENVISKPSRKSQISALLKAQNACFKAGLTCVCDAGLDKDVILLLDSLQNAGDLKIRVYAMCNPSPENFDYFKEQGAISTERLQVSSFKLYADGALGSYGAMLRDPYCDRSEHHGLWITAPNRLEEYIAKVADLGFQVNTHCIGDSANHLVLGLYAKYLKGPNDLRWRIEHAQVVSPEDRHLFKDYGIIPSIQPTHATSDMYWADRRLCPERLDHAYAYKQLLLNSDYIALGTDFPIEDISPLNTFFASVYRMDLKNYPPGGYQAQDALDPQSTLLGMTLWAARANFMDDRIGSLEPGKLADFIVLDTDLMVQKQTYNSRVIATYLDGVLMQ